MAVFIERWLNCRGTPNGGGERKKKEVKQYKNRKNGRKQVHDIKVGTGKTSWLKVRTQFTMHNTQVAADRYLLGMAKGLRNKKFHKPKRV